MSNNTNNTNTNTNNYKLKNINDLNMNKDIDILYFIINLKEYYNNILNTNKNIDNNTINNKNNINTKTITTNNNIDTNTINNDMLILPDILINKLKSIKIKDSNIGLFCLQRIEKEILREIGEEDIDKEIIEIYNSSNSNNTNIINNIINNDNICNDNNIINNIINNTINNDNNINYLYNFNIIISPFLFTNNKVCVDFISYIYKKVGIDYFSILFDAYKDKTDLLLELHLLRCRIMIMRNRLNNNSNKSNNSNILNNTDKLNNSNIIDNILNNILNNNIIDNTDSNICKYSIDDHLTISKDILLNITKKEQKFYIENASLYLTLRYDREILKTLIGTIGEIYFFTSIHNSINILSDNNILNNTLYNNNTIIPWYLYKYVYINTCIYYDLPYNPYTLKYYLEYITSISNNIFSNEIGYILVSIKLREYMINTLYNIIQYDSINNSNILNNSNLLNNTKIKDNNINNSNMLYSSNILYNMFINVFRHILTNIIKCNIIRIDEIYDNILDNINIYIILLYNTNSKLNGNTLYKTLYDRLYKTLYKNSKLNGNTNSKLDGNTNSKLDGNISIDRNDFIISNTNPSTDLIIHQHHIDYICDKIKDNKYVDDILDDYEHNITYDSKYIIDILESYYKNIMECNNIKENKIDDKLNSKIDDKLNNNNKLKKQLENIHIKDNTNNTNICNIKDNTNTNICNIKDNTNNILDNNKVYNDDINSLLITLINSRKHRYKLVSSIVNNTYIEYIDKDIRNKIYDIINITYNNITDNNTNNTNISDNTNNIFDKGDWRYNTFIKDNIEILKNKLL